MIIIFGKVFSILAMVGVGFLLYRSGKYLRPSDPGKGGRPRVLHRADGGTE